MLTIIAVGKLKNSAYRDLCADYLKRLKRFEPVEFIELEDEPCDNNNRAVNKEGEAILAHLPKKAYIIACDPKGKSFSSEGFAEKLSALNCAGNSNLCFIIGGSAGLSENVKVSCDMLLSFSSFTFPHNLFRVILLEQLYRAHKIISGETYHK